MAPPLLLSHKFHEFLSSFPLFSSIDSHLNHEERTS